MARELGPEGFGIFTFVMTLMLLVSLVSRLGQPEILTREVSRSREQVHDYFANTISMQIVGSLPVLVLVVLLGPSFGMDATTQAVSALLGVAVVGEALIATYMGVFQAHQRMVLLPPILLTQRWSIAAMGIAALLLGAGVVTVAALYLLGTVLGLAVAHWLLIRRIVRPRREIDLRRWWPLLRNALPIGIAGVFNTVLSRIDIALLGAFDGTRVVGEYGAAYRIFDGSLFLSWAVSAAVFPVMSRLGPRTSPPVRAVFERGCKLGLALAMPIGIGAIVFAEPLVRLLYGAEYRDAPEVLAILGPAIVLFPLAFIATEALVSQDRQRDVLWVAIVLAIANVAANLALIPVLSLIGAAIVTSATQLAVVVLLFIRSAKAVEGFSLWRMAAGPVSAGVAFLAVGLALSDSLWLGAIAATLAYAVVLLVVEVRLFPDDAQLVRRAVARALPDDSADRPDDR